MQSDTTNESSREPSDPFNQYVDTYGYAGEVMSAISKLASNTGQVKLMLSLYEEQLKKGEPVTDWKKFGEPLLKHFSER